MVFSFPLRNGSSVSFRRALRAGRLLLLVLGERFVELLDGDLLLLRGQDDLPREHDGHGPRRLAEEVVDGSPETGLDVLDGRREVGPDLRRTLDAEGLDRV